MITTTRRKTKHQETKKYKHLEVLRQWYDLSALFLSNVTSLDNQLDEVIIPVKPTSANVVATAEA